MHKEKQPLNPQMSANKGGPSGSTTSLGISGCSDSSTEVNGNSSTPEFITKSSKQLTAQQKDVIRTLVYFQHMLESPSEDELKLVAVCDIARLVMQTKTNV